MPFEFETDPRFKRRLKRKPRVEQDRIYDCIQRLTNDPHEQGGRRSKPLSVSVPEKVWYARVSDANRLTFHFEGSKMVFRNNCNHDEVLRSP